MSEGIEIRHACQFISSLVRALAKLPGGLGRFLPCRIGSHLESCHHQCLKAVCGLLGYPQGSASELLDGTLKAPILHYSFYQAFSPMVFTQGR